MPTDCAVQTRQGLPLRARPDASPSTPRGEAQATREPAAQAQAAPTRPTPMQSTQEEAEAAKAAKERLGS